MIYVLPFAYTFESAIIFKTMSNKRFYLLRSWGKLYYAPPFSISPLLPLTPRDK